MLGLALAVAAPVFGGCGGGGDDVVSTPCPEVVVPTTRAGDWGGVLLDTHTHLDEPGVAAALACALGPHEVEQAAIVAPMDPDDTFPTESAYREAVAGREGTFLPFFDVGARTPADLGPGRLERVLVEVGLFFRGVYSADLSLVPAATFDWAGERDLFVAVGPTPAADLAGALRAHPSTKVLVLGPATPDGLPALLRDHDRLFVTLDASTLGRGDWLPVVQAAPDRVMWGSGVRRADEASPVAYGELVAATRHFVGALPQPFRRGFAVGNARRLLGIHEPPAPDA